MSIFKVHEYKRVIPIRCREFHIFMQIIFKNKDKLSIQRSRRRLKYIFIRYFYNKIIVIQSIRRICSLRITRQGSGIAIAILTKIKAINTHLIKIGAVYSTIRIVFEIRNTRL